MLRRLFSVLGIALTLSGGAAAQQATDCRSCAMPCLRRGEQSFTVEMQGGRPDPSQRFTGLRRDSAVVAGEHVQALRLQWLEGSVCRDTIIPTDHLAALVFGVTLGKVAPMAVPVHPVREYVRTTTPTLTTNFVEASVYAGYAGSDTSSRPTGVGIDDLYYGAHVLVAPFGRMLGEHTTLALGAGVMRERDRLRIPVTGQLRFTFSKPQERTVTRYVPDACRFGCPDTPTDTVPAPSGADWVERPGPGVYDPSSIITRERVIDIDTLAPYLFVEGGLLFDTPFEGSGAHPSENPDDYGQFQLGGGVGLPLTSWLHASLAYRYLRLNVRTPCVDCGTVYQVNTTMAHSIMLQVALHWGW